MIFEGRSGPPVPLSGSAHALHPPMSKSRANVLLIFQCPGICPPPSQVDILVSDDSLAFCPTMYNRVFTWVIRIKSEVGTVKHVEALQFFFLLAQISSIVFLYMLKNWPLPCTVVCVLVLVVGEGGQDVITIQTSAMTPLSATVARVSTGVGGWGSGYKCISLSQRVFVYACAK